MSNSSKVKFQPFDMLKRYAEKKVQPEEAASRRRPAPYRSANFFDGPEMHVEDEAFCANSRAGLNHDPKARTCGKNAATKSSSGGATS